MCRPEVDRQIELLSLEVDRDDRRGASQGRALHDVQADAPAAEDDHGAAGLDPGGVEDGADTRDDAAGEQRRRCHRDVVVDRHDLGGVHDDLLGEGGRPHAMADRLAFAVDQRRAIVEREDRPARNLGPTLTAVALAARTNQRHDDTLARLEPDAGADLLDRSGSLVAPDRRQIASPFAVGVREVAVADRHGVEPDSDLSRARIGELQSLDRERCVELATHGGVHRGGHQRPGFQIMSTRPDDESEVGDADAGASASTSPTRWCR